MTSRPGSSSSSPGCSTPQMLVVGVVMLMGVNYWMQQNQPRSMGMEPVLAPGTSAEDATTRNLVLSKLQGQLRERDTRISDLEKRLQDAQRADHATLGAQPPQVPTEARKRLEEAPPKPRTEPAAVPGGAPSSTVVVQVSPSGAGAAPAGDAAAGGELVEVPADEVFPDKLRKAKKYSDLFVSFSSASMSAFALNWVANLKIAGITQILVGALDEKMLEIATAEGVPSMPLDGSSIKNRGAANLRFDYSAYKRMAALKVAFYTRILKMGFNLWACDADTGWMGDPTPFVNQYPMQYVDMLTTTDCIDLAGDQHGGCWHVDHNTGLVYMRSRPIVLEFLAAWKKKIETTRDIMVRRHHLDPHSGVPPPSSHPQAPSRWCAPSPPSLRCRCATRRRSTC